MWTNILGIIGVIIILFGMGMAQGNILLGLIVLFAGVSLIYIGTQRKKK